MEEADFITIVFHCGVSLVSPPFLQTGIMYHRKAFESLPKEDHSHQTCRGEWLVTPLCVFDLSGNAIVAKL